jgi:hypothetical protein
MVETSAIKRYSRDTVDMQTVSNLYQNKNRGPVSEGRHQRNWLHVVEETIESYTVNAAVAGRPFRID